MSKLDKLIAELCPDGVEYKRLGEMASIYRGGNFQKKDFSTVGVPCIHYGQIYVSFNLFVDSVLTYIPNEIATHQKFADSGDIIMAVTSENIDDVCKCIAWLGIITSGDYSCKVNIAWRTTKSMNKLTMHNMGPVSDCLIELKEFNVITGPQSQGKSTIAKAVYFFRSVKQTAVEIMRLGGPEKVNGEKNARWSKLLEKRLKENFLNIFGTSWVLPVDMRMKYEYGQENKFIEVSVTPNRNQQGKNYLKITFSQIVDDFFFGLDSHCYTGISQNQLKQDEIELFAFFDDPFEVFIFLPEEVSLLY